MTAPVGSAADPFGTGALRSAVLATWAASPARFREDANAEESLAIGYADRVVAELAANAADAARAAGVPGRMRITIEDRELRAANTGAPLTAAGVAALASLRASAKRAPTPGAGEVRPGPTGVPAVTDGPRAPFGAAPEASVGHFGVGFTAVRALTDTPSVASTTGGIRFSAADTLTAAAALGVPGLDAEIASRSGHLAALRLPWPLPGSADPPPDGFDTEVRLPLRDDVDVDGLAGTLTAQACLDLLWALPELRSVRLGDHQATRGEPAGATEPLTVEVDGVARRFRTVEASGRIPDELLADRPVEERGRSGWRLTWVLPLDQHDQPQPLSRSMIGAPTATDEALSLPAALIGTFPVDDTRRHPARGALADHLIARAVEQYLDLVLACPPDQRVALIPPAGFPAGPVDAQLRDGVLAALPVSPWLTGADGRPLRPVDARMVSGLTGGAAGLFADVLPGLLPAPSSGSAASIARALRSVGVSTIAVGELSAALAGLDRPVDFWLAVYDALTAVLAESGADLDELADLPVPREGGGTIIGPRGVLVPDPGAALAGDSESDSAAGSGRDPGAALATESASDSLAKRSASVLARAAALIPGLRIAAAGVAHPLLHRLGAGPADPAAILADPFTGAEIHRRREDLEEFDPDPEDVAAFGDLIADLVGAAGPAGIGRPAIGDPRSGGAAAPTSLAAVLLTDVNGEAWPAGDLLLPDAPLARVLVHDADLPTVGRGWIDRHGQVVLEALGVRSGFSVVDVAVPPNPRLEIDGLADWWDEVGSHAGPIDSVPVITDLDLVDDASWPTALTMIMSARQTRDALHPIGFGPSYAAWWIGRHAQFGGAPANAWRAADATVLAGLFDVFPVELPAGAGAGIGALADLDAAIARSPSLLVARWADPRRRPPPANVPALTAAVVSVLAGDPELDLPAAVRTVDGGVVDAGLAVVLDQPWLAAVVPSALVVAGGDDPSAVSATLDIDLASDVVHVEMATGSADVTRLRDIPAAARWLDFFGMADRADTPVTVEPGLAVRVAIRDNPTQTLRVGWWVLDGRPFTDGGAAGIGRLVAHLAGRWGDRHLFTAIAAGDAAAPAEAALR